MPGREHRSRWAGVAVMVGLTATVGCTMCPDPYDYSGPVPNGSAPQNDFRVRSNGIIPTGAATKPWPPVVKSVMPQRDAPVPEPLPDDEPLVADAGVAPAPADEMDVVRLSTQDAVVDAPTGAAVVAAGDTGVEAAEQRVPAADHGGDLPSVTEPTGDGEPGGDDPVPDVGPSAGLAEPARIQAEPDGRPAVRETPGWRPRR